jgi:hypothetical protein
MLIPGSISWVNIDIRLHICNHRQTISHISSQTEQTGSTAQPHVAAIVTIKHQIVLVLCNRSDRDPHPDNPTFGQQFATSRLKSFTIDR